MRGTIRVDEALCKGCELCVSVCPKQVIGRLDRLNARGYRPVVLVDPGGQCTGCLLCSTICPDAAITVYREAKPTTATRASTSATAGVRVERG